MYHRKTALRDPPPKLNRLGEYVLSLVAIACRCFGFPRMGATANIAMYPKQLRRTRIVLFFGTSQVFPKGQLGYTLKVPNRDRYMRVGYTVDICICVYIGNAHGIHPTMMFFSRVLLLQDPL